MILLVSGSSSQVLLFLACSGCDSMLASYLGYWWPPDGGNLLRSLKSARAYAQEKGLEPPPLPEGVCLFVSASFYRALQI